MKKHFIRSFDKGTYLSVSYTSNDSERELQEKIMKIVGNRFLADSARISGGANFVGFVFKGNAALLKAVGRVLELKSKLPLGYHLEIKICDF